MKKNFVKPEMKCHRLCADKILAASGNGEGCKKQEGCPQVGYCGYPFTCPFDACGCVGGENE